MYDYGREEYGNGGFKFTDITTVPKSPKGCAAGSVWHQDASGGVSLASRTAESGSSVWRKINGTEREWFEEVYRGVPGQPWVKSKTQIVNCPPPSNPPSALAQALTLLSSRSVGRDEDTFQGERPPPVRTRVRWRLLQKGAGDRGRLRRRRGLGADLGQHAGRGEAQSLLEGAVRALRWLQNRG